jgi:hypothetical protein
MAVTERITLCKIERIHTRKTKVIENETSEKEMNEEKKINAVFDKHVPRNTATQPSRSSAPKPGKNVLPQENVNSYSCLQLTSSVPYWKFQSSEYEQVRVRFLYIPIYVYVFPNGLFP